MSSAMVRETTEFLGLTFHQATEFQVIEDIKRLSRADSFAFVVTPNVDHLVRLRSESPQSALWRSYRTADLRLCDSRILQLLARFSGIVLSTVPGSDLTARLLNDHLQDFAGVAVIGGDPRLLDKLARTYPNCTWHHHLPPMGVQHDVIAQRAIIDFVTSTPAELFLFAIGSPQSELLCAEIQQSDARGVGLCIGASLEFLTGAKKRAPLWMQRLRLEWLFRLLSEPRRLWRRYLVDGPKIISLWCRWHFSGAHGRAASDSRRPDVS
jgi:exopolysaccharide biosynthesis WecB/TagA/CpsF family protein